MPKHIISPVRERSALEVAKAELLTMLYCATTLNAQAGKKLIWIPRLYAGETPMQLDFFVQATDRKAGMRNLLACIGLPGTQQSHAELEDSTTKYAKSLPQWESYRIRNLLSTLGFAKSKSNRN